MTSVLQVNYIFHVVLIENLGFAVWKDWSLLDTALGAWLLNPDNTTASFSELLARFGMQQMTPPTQRGDIAIGHSYSILHNDLSLLGPLMVKIYKELQVSYSCI